MKNGKRILPVILAVLMVVLSIGVLPENAVAASQPKMAKSNVTVKVGNKQVVGLTSNSINSGWRITDAKSADRTVATVTKNAKKITVRGKNAGSVLVKVTVKNNSKTKNLRVGVNVLAKTIAVSSVSLINSMDVKVGSTQPLSATISPINATNQTLNWTSSNTSIATVDSNGNVKGIAIGTTNITATAANGKSATCKVTVKAADILATTLSLNYTSKEMNIGTSADITAYMMPTTANSTITWKSDTPSVATVTDKGNGKAVIVGVGLGSAKIYATTSNGLTKYCTITVKTDAIRLSSTERSILVGEVFDLTSILSSTYYNAQVSWLTDSPNVASITDFGNGRVTVVGKGSGTAKIYAYLSSSLYAVCTVDVSPVRLNITNKTISISDSFELSASVSSMYSYSWIKWTSDNPAVASVIDLGSGRATVVGNGIGTTRICATTSNGTAGYCIVSVNSGYAAKGIKLNYDAKQANIGDAIQLTAYLEPSYATTSVSWSSSDSSVATVSTTGYVICKKAGTAVIKALTSNGYAASCTVTVVAREASATKVTLSSQTQNAIVGEEIQLSATVTPANAKTAFTWASSDPSVATVTQNGKVTCVGEGVAHIIVTISDGSYDECLVTVTQSVIPATEIEFYGFEDGKCSVSIKVGESIAVFARIYPHNSTSELTWSAFDERVCVVEDYSGDMAIVTGVSKGTTAVIATTENGITNNIVVHVVE